MPTKEEINGRINDVNTKFLSEVVSYRSLVIIHDKVRLEFFWSSAVSHKAI